MDQVIHDLGSHMNVLPKQTWEHMGRPALQWSPIQLQMENQQKILLMGRLQGITVDIEGVSMIADFEVIEIFDDNNPYPTLLGIDQAANMNGVINIKKHKMIFEKNSLRIVVPLDPVEGVHYTKPMCDEKSDNELDYIYKITTQEQDWVNPIADGWVSWECESSYTSDSDEEIEQWQNRLHELTTLNCNMIVRSLCCVTTEVRDLPMYDGLTVVDEFLTKFESTIPEQQWFVALKWALRATPAR